MSRWLALGALSAMAVAAAPTASPPPAASLPGDLPLHLVRVRSELDLFAPAGRHEKPAVRLVAPIVAEGQVPLRARVETAPPNQVVRWRFDDDGQLDVELMPQEGEKHVRLITTIDLVVGETAAGDDARHRASITKRAPSTAQKPWMRRMDGVDPESPEVAKAAAEIARSSGDLVTLARAIDELVATRVRRDPNGTLDGSEALAKGAGSPLARARLAAALALAHGAPVRLAAAVPLRGGEPLWLVEVHGGDAGWLRLDVERRGTPPFPWPEDQDLLVLRVDADLPLPSRARPRWFAFRGGISAGVAEGAAAYSVRTLHDATLSRAVAKELMPALAAAWNETARTTRGATDAMTLLDSPRVAKVTKAAELMAALRAALEKAP